MAEPDLGLWPSSNRLAGVRAAGFFGNPRVSCNYEGGSEALHRSFSTVQEFSRDDIHLGTTKLFALLWSRVGATPRSRRSDSTHDRTVPGGGGRSARTTLRIREKLFVRAPGCHRALA